MDLSIYHHYRFLISEYFVSHLNRSLLTLDVGRYSVTAGARKLFAMREAVGIVGISGSLRRVSFSPALLKTLAQKAAPAIDLEVVTLEDIPFYNEDLDIDPAIPAVGSAQEQGR
jgi:hypothetical protein